MDEDEYIEVTITDSSTKIPTSKTLSTIREYDSTTSRSPVQNVARGDADNSKNFKSSTECLPHSKQRLNSLRGSCKPFDVDLLLRYYACNANMEKSIKKVFGEHEEIRDEKCLNFLDDSLVNLVSKDVEKRPLVELGAVYKIFNLSRQSSDDSLLVAFRFQETFTELQSLIARYNAKELERILSNDPSVRICKHCGVISCAKSGNVSVETRQSPPRASYFLNARTLSNDDKRVWKRKRETGKIGNIGSSREEKSQTNAPQRVEIMVAERENVNETPNVGSSRKLKRKHNDKTTDSDFLVKTDLQRPKSRNEQKDRETSIKSRRNEDEFNEKVINDILYIKSKSELSNFTKQNQNISSIINTMARLKQDCLELKDTQLVLHPDQNYNSQLDSSFTIYDESNRPKRAAKNVYNYAECRKWIEYAKNNKQSSNLACLMENDSLENLTKASSSMVRSDQSNTTACSSSSAENLVHEWNERSIAWKPVVQSDSLYKKNQTKHRSPARQVSSDDSKTRNSGKVEGLGRKRFSIKRLFGSLRSLKSTRSVRSNNLNVHPSTSSNDNSSNTLNNIARRISYDESLLKTMNDGGCDGTANTLLLYRRILENTEKMDWDTFQRFIENLHASQRDVWQNICDAINKEARRIADKSDGITEVCIEISSIPRDGTKNRGRTCGDEIVFEMDIALRDVEGFLDRQQLFAEKGHLDTLERASEVIRVRNDDVCNIEVASNQAE
ncbi:uncharacterized protein LOC122402582 [Colletes gigas]|uniref:uncharacterized protein LOC122402582 n=1 Tax=Colletes gigas TaxID=935657 RepID=UPI001C9B42AA|nr:uncharacterized protein LOC122402582 [Colletes gigas]